MPGGQAALTRATESGQGGVIGSRRSRMIVRSKERAGLLVIQPHATQVDSRREAEQRRHIAEAELLSARLDALKKEAA